MKHVYYYEYYPHFMGTRTAVVKMTAKEFEQLCAIGRKLVGFNDDAAYDEYHVFVDALEKKTKTRIFAMQEAFYKRGRVARIISKLNKGEAWSGEWEEGSFAFATKIKDAKEAVRKIELKHIDL